MSSVKYLPQYIDDVYAGAWVHVGTFSAFIYPCNGRWAKTPDTGKKYGVHSLVLEINELLTERGFDTISEAKNFCIEKLTELNERLREKLKQGTDE